MQTQPSTLSYFSLNNLSTKGRIFLFLLSLIIVAFGQPAWVPSFGLVASCMGFALFWGSVLYIPSQWLRFGLAVLWFTLVQLVQLSWLISHPYLYIYGLYFFLSIGMGLQFGFVTWLIQPFRLQSYSQLLALAGLWTLMEWVRLFFLSGFSFNPVGLALTGNIYSLQMASLFGVYGLSFVIIFVNLLALRAWMQFKLTLIPAGLWILALIMPYLYGVSHYVYHDKRLTKSFNENQASFNALLLQTAFPIEENLQFQNFKEAVDYVKDEWREILKTIKIKQGPDYDLIALPEYVVPYGTYLPIYRYDEVKEIFHELFGAQSLSTLPPLQEPLAFERKVGDELTWTVTNAYWSQAIANLFNADVVVGLQDDQWVSEKEQQSFSSAFYFWPHGNQGLRYEKRVLVPMGEYIPFAFCREIAKSYGICGSFTCGTEAKVFPGSKLPFGLSICYEETYGDLMRENRQKGAEMLINLTSDVWYPGSKLPKQHFDHARLRTVECGIPLLRACNTGVTAAFDSLGRVVAILGDGTSHTEWLREGLFAKVPTYNYKTIYSKFGDSLIICFSFFSLFFFTRRKE